MPIRLPIAVELIPKTEKAKRKIQKDLSTAEVDVGTKGSKSGGIAGILSGIANFFKTGIGKIFGILSIIGAVMVALEPLTQLLQNFMTMVGILLMPIGMVLAKMLMPVVAFMLVLFMKWNRWFKKYFGASEEAKKKIEKKANEEATKEVAKKYGITEKEAIKTHGKEIEKAGKLLADRMKATYNLFHFDPKDILGPISQLIDLFTIAWSYAKEWLPQIDWKKIKEWFDNLISGIGSTVTSFLGNLPVEFGKFLNGMTEWFNSLISGLNEKWDKFKTKLGDTLTSIRDKIKSVWNNFISRIKSAVNGIIDKIKHIHIHVPKIHLPSIGGIFNAKKVGDLIISNGRAYETSPNDTIIATKSGMGKTFNITINITGNPDRNIIDTLKRELRSELLRVGRW